MKNIWRLFELIPEYKSRILTITILSGLFGLVGIVTPILFKNILDSISVALTQSQISASTTNEIAYLLAITLGVYVLSAIFSYINEVISDSIFIDINTTFRQRIFEHLNNVPIDYFEKNRVGEIVEKAGNTSNNFARWVFTLSDGLLGWVFTIIFTCAYLVTTMPIIGVIVTFSISVNLFIAIKATLKTAPIRKAWHINFEKGTGELSESIKLVTTVRSFAQEKFKLEKFKNEAHGYRTKRYVQAKIEWKANFLRNVLNAVIIVVILAVLTYQIANGSSTVGDIVLVSLYITQLRGSTNPMARAVLDTGELETSATRILGVLDVKPMVFDTKGAKPIKTISSIEFKNVSFSYPETDQVVLSDVSFRINKGETVALVGPSGVGKTTITKLLMRFYEPTSGEILINGSKVENYTQDSIRSVIGPVMQDVALFNETVEENIKFAKPSATKKEILSAIKIAHADEFIEKLPQKLETLVGERGIKLSGGQKQRVAIARAILRNPQLVILDEATSSLDSKSERLVQDGLAKLLREKTAVIIAHRLSTVRKADKILVIDGGTIAEQGTHDQLLKTNGLYAKLVKMQNGLA